MRCSKEFSRSYFADASNSLPRIACIRLGNSSRVASHKESAQNETYWSSTTGCQTKMNPATRLLVIYDTLIQQQGDRAMLNIWASVLGLDEKNAHLEDDVTTCLVALRQQIDFARMRLDSHGVPQELTQPGFDLLKTVASPSHLNSGWHGHRGNILAPECRHAFTWSAWVLGDEDEADLPTEEMTALLADIEALENGLQTSEISPYLRDFIQRQVDTIRAALRLYDLQGARPLQDALQRVAGAYTVERGRLDKEYEVAPEESKGILAKAGSMIKKTAEVCDSLDKIKKFGGEVGTLAASVGPIVVPYITNLLK